jgi:phage virion morphogenesis protein
MAKIKIAEIDKITQIIEKKIDAMKTKKILEEVGQLILAETVKRMKNNEIKPRTSAAALLQRRAKGYKRIKDAKKQATRTKLMGSSITLVDTGTLLRSIKYSVDTNRSIVCIGTNLEYAALHQFGGKAGINKSVNIPKRPFLFFTGVTRIEIGRIIKRAMESIQS